MMKRARDAVRGGALAAFVIAVSVPAAAVATPPVVSADGQGLQAQEWWLDGLGVRQAWQTTQGEGATICLIDSGIDRTHPDLRNADLAPGGGIGQGFEPSGALTPAHGTSMAGLIVGQGHGPGNRDGILGIAPKATLISWGISTDAADSSDQISSAIRGCSDLGADIINLSNTGTGDETDVAYAQEKGAVVIGSTGNNGPGYISNNFLGQVSVGGVMSDLSSWPLTSTPPSLEVQGNLAPMALSAPAAQDPGPNGEGEAILLPSVDGELYESRRLATSGASAITAGIAALVKSAHPDLDAANIVNRLVATATVPSGEQSPSLQYGFGIVNAAAAVDDEVPTVETNPLGDIATGDLGLWDGEDNGTSGAQPDAATGPISMGTIVTLLVGAGLILAVVVALIVVLTRRGRPRA